jgi:hypothetical protein
MQGLHVFHGMRLKSLNDAVKKLVCSLHKDELFCGVKVGEGTQKKRTFKCSC